MAILKQILTSYGLFRRLFFVKQNCYFNFLIFLFQVAPEFICLTIFSYVTVIWTGFHQSTTTHTKTSQSSRTFQNLFASINKTLTSPTNRSKRHSLSTCLKKTFSAATRPTALNRACAVTFTHAIAACNAHLDVNANTTLIGHSTSSRAQTRITHTFQFSSPWMLRRSIWTATNCITLINKTSSDVTE